MNITSMRLPLLILVLLPFTDGFGASAASTAASVVLKDYSGAAAGLFSNMRTPAALIGGAIVPLGIITAPKIEDSDTPRAKLYKKANILLAIASLLSEVVAITLSTIAINKLNELSAAPTEGVAELISQHYELQWIGTNIHFLFGLFGFGLLAIAKPYFLYGRGVGNVAACWSSAAMMFCVSVVNRGISMGHGSIEDSSAKFAGNLFGLTMKYVRLVMGSAKSGLLPAAALGILVYSLVPLKRVIDGTSDNEKPKAD